MTDLVPQRVTVELRFAVSLLRHLTKLLRPEVVGIAVMAAATEVGIPRKKALGLAERFMVEARVPKGWRPWPWVKKEAEEKR